MKMMGPSLLDNLLQQELKPQEQEQEQRRTPLPEDCLAIIIQLLCHDRSALHSLLLVSRQFFRLVVPVLYRSPFRLLESNNEPWTYPERTQRQVLLLQLFLKVIQMKHNTNGSPNMLKKTQLRKATRRRIWQKEKKHQHAVFTVPVPVSVPVPETITTNATSDPTKQPTTAVAEPHLSSSVSMSMPIPLWSGPSKKSLRFTLPLTTSQNKRRDWTSPLTLSKKESNVKSFLSLSLSSPSQGSEMGHRDDNYYKDNRDNNNSHAMRKTTIQPNVNTAHFLHAHVHTHAHAKQQQQQQQQQRQEHSGQWTAETDIINPSLISSRSRPYAPTSMSATSGSVPAFVSAPASSTAVALASQQGHDRAARVIKTIFSMPGMYAAWWTSAFSFVPSSSSSSSSSASASACASSSSFSCSSSICTSGSGPWIEPRHLNPRQGFQCNNGVHCSQPSQQQELLLQHHLSKVDNTKWENAPNSQVCHDRVSDSNLNTNKQNGGYDGWDEASSQKGVSCNNNNDHHNNSDECSCTDSDTEGSSLHLNCNNNNVCPAPTPWPCTEPDLGPFSPPPPPRTPIHGLGHWPNVFHPKRNSSSNKQGSAEQDKEKQQNKTGHLMADYLYHYVEHDHPHLVRQLSFIFPSIPRQVFDELSPMTLSSSSTMPLSSSPRSSSASSNHTVLNLFQSFQQPQKNARTIEVAQATRTKIEQDLLLHAPQQIKTLCISAPRFHTILRVIQAEEEERAKQPQTPKVARQQPWEMKEPLHRQSPTSSFTSLLSFLSSSSPFSASTLPSSISSTSSWSSASSSVSLTSPSTSAQSSRTSTISGTTSTASLHSWRGTPRISCKLSRLTRLELLDVHFRFDIDAIIEFLKTHDHVYGTICEIKVGGPDDLGRSTPPGLIRILQSLKTVKVLDMTDWREAIKYLDMIPTKHLETLLLGNVRMTTLNSSGSVINGEVTAQTLEDLAHALEGLVPTAAATASASTSGIQSMNNNDQEGASDSNREDPQIRTLQSCRQLKELRMPVLVDGLFEWAVRERHQSQRIARRWEDHVDPVQIQVVHLSGSNTGPLVPTLVHVADAFRASLQTLQSTSWSDMAETLSSCQSLSWNWSLPQLQVLDLQGEVACRLKVQAVVEYCPALRVLRLSLPHSVLPSSASSFVTAVGTAATISIRDEHTQAGQDEGLGHVDDSEAHGYVSWRYASLANLFTPRGTKNNQRQGCCAITLPKLQELSIAGDWGLDNSSLLGMAEVVPGLTRLSLLRCEGVSVGGLVDAMSLLKSLRWLEVNRGWHSELQQAANAIADNSMNDKIEVSSK